MYSSAAPVAEFTHSSPGNAGYVILPDLPMAALADLVTLACVLALALVHDPSALDLSAPRLPLALILFPVALALAAASPGGGSRATDLPVGLAVGLAALAAMACGSPWAASNALVAVGLASGAYLLGRRAGTRERLLAGIARGSLALLSVASIAMLGAFTRPAGPDLSTGVPTLALVGPLGNPDYLAGWLVAVLPLAATGPRGRAWLAAGLVALAWTLSRGAALGLALAAALVYRPRRLFEHKAILLALAAAFVVGGFVTLPGDRAKLASPVTFVKRTAIWRTAWQLALERPWLGHGPGSFPAAYEAARPHDPLGPGRMPPSDFAHDLPLQVAVEYGLAGLALLAWGLVPFVRAVPRASDPAARALACGALAFLVHNLVSVTAYVLPVLLLGALVAGAAVTRILPAGQSSSVGPTAAAALALALACAAPAAVTRARASHEAGLAKAALARGRAADALPHALAALDLEPLAPAHRYLAAAALAESGKPREALVQYLLLEALEPGFGHQGFDRARVLLDLSRPAAAVCELERVLSVDPDQFNAWYALAEARWALGDRSASQAALARARALAPTPDLQRRLDALAHELTAPPAPTR